MKKFILSTTILFAVVLILGTSGSAQGRRRDRRVDPLEITSTGIPTALEGQPYFYQLQATGGRVPYEWSVVSGELPDGINLRPDGVLRGVARHVKTPDRFKFRVQVQDSSKQR